DLRVHAPMNAVMSVFSLVVALGIAWYGARGRWRMPGILLLVWIVAGLVLLVVAPSLYQRFVVAPNELAQEWPYIEANIALTRYAYGLDRVATGELEGDVALRPEQIAREPETVEAIRIWDSRVLLTTLRQLQRFRQYYDYTQVDIDRYALDGRQQQVMLAARELDIAELPAVARTWQNQHLIYTHGWGVVVVPVNRANAQGQPEFLVKDIPATDGAGGPVPAAIRLDRPQLYFGE